MVGEGCNSEGWVWEYSPSATSNLISCEWHHVWGVSQASLVPLRLRFCAPLNGPFLSLPPERRNAVCLYVGRQSGMNTRPVHSVHLYLSVCSNHSACPAGPEPWSMTFSFSSPWTLRGRKEGEAERKEGGYGGGDREGGTDRQAVRTKER